MSKAGERTQGKPGSPIPLGFGRGLTTSVADFASPNYEGHVKQRNYVVTGITKDSAGSPLGGVTVDVFETLSDVFCGRGISDATTGAYTVFVNAPDTGRTFYARADLAGAPEQAGTTVDVMTVIEL
jgi:hypothetical protein